MRTARIFLIVWLVMGLAGCVSYDAASQNQHPDYPCPNWGKDCPQTPINGWDQSINKPKE